MTPRRRKLALRAMRLARKGEKGKAIAEKLGLANAPEANALAETGRLIERDERGRLTDGERQCIELVDAVEQRHLAAGITRSAEASAIDHMAGRARGWCARTVERRLRRRTPDEEQRLESPALGFVWHTRNGYVGLTEAGRAIAHLLRGKRR
jgi:hypothetical protein